MGEKYTVTSTYTADVEKYTAEGQQYTATSALLTERKLSSLMCVKYCADNHSLHKMRFYCLCSSYP